MKVNFGTMHRSTYRVIIASAAALALVACGQDDTTVSDVPSGSGPDLPSKAMGTDRSGSPCNVWSGLSNDDLLGAIHQRISSEYRPIQVEVDRGGNPNRYTTARRLMFTEIERRPSADGGPFLAECIYTGTTAPAPKTAEPNIDLLNAEHLWPRSRMLDEAIYPVLFSHQESDIHAMFPAVPKANSSRGNLPFGRVVSNRNLDFSPSVLGDDGRGERVFEVRPQRRGDVARALFYFSVRWGLAIDPVEAATLKDWNRQDMPDDLERSRNEIAQRIQGNRNPFIDCPELVDQVSDYRGFSSLDNDSNLPNP